MLARVGSDELAEWRIMYRLDPSLAERVDLAGGIIASTIANVNRKKGSQPFKPADFMPLVEKPKATKNDQSFETLRASIAESKRKATRRKRTS